MARCVILVAILVAVLILTIVVAIRLYGSSLELLNYDSSNLVQILQRIFVSALILLITIFLLLLIGVELYAVMVLVMECWLKT
jgi:heme/copper-type cytochrome/quinol oxidase subunit 2